MRYEALVDPVEFSRRTVTLLADQARHNLMRGILGNILKDRQAYEDYQLFIVSQDNEALAAALMTKPYNLVLADVPDGAPVVELVAGLVADGVAVPGAIGNRPTVEWFVAEWKRATGDNVSLGMEQGVFAIDKVIPARTVLGRARRAATDDADLVHQWLDEFIDEALRDEPRNDARLKQIINRRLDGKGPGAIWLWDVEGAPMSMSSHGSPTGSGIRISGVYTPPRLRGRGYASALVAAQSGWLLDNGYEFCFLFTDLANPTSNGIYERIGYQRVAEGASYTFSPGT